MIKPPTLKNGDTVGIVAPAGWILQDKYRPIIQIIENRGYKVLRGTTTYKEHGPFAGTDGERLIDMQAMLDNPVLKAVFCLRGGYGTIRIIDKLDFTEFKKSPKWIIGFSDITILHNKLHLLGIASIHGQMPLNFVDRTSNKGLDELFATLNGKTLNYSIEPNLLNRQGEAKAQIVGGNVAILSSLVGTPFDIDTDGKILFIEEVGEYLYRFDRFMHHLKLSGKLAKLKGLIVGGLTNMKDNSIAFGQSDEQIIADLTTEYSYPVCFAFPAGHIKENYPLILGAEAELKVSNTGVSLNYK